MEMFERFETEEQKSFHASVNSLFDLAKVAWKRFLIVQLAVGIFSISLLLPGLGDRTKALIAVGAVLLQVAAWILNDTCNKQKSEAERQARLMHIWFGLGYRPEDADPGIESIDAEAGSRPLTYAFSSMLSEGVPGFLHVLCVNAFFLEQLYKKCAQKFARLLGLAVAGMVIGFIVFFLIGPTSGTQQISLDSIHSLVTRIIGVLIAISLSTNVVGIIHGWKDAASKLRALREKLEIFLRKEEALQQNTIDGEVLNYIVDFYQAQAKAPLIPWHIHQSKRATLIEKARSRLPLFTAHSPS